MFSIAKPNISNGIVFFSTGLLHNSSSQLPVTPNFSLFAGQAAYWDQCPVIDKNFIENRIYIDSHEVRQKIARIILEIMESDEHIRDYISFIFMHLPEFIITTKDKINENGIYIPASKTMLINPKYLSLPNRLMQVLRHELRHASMHTAQLALSQIITDSCSVISPRLSHSLLIKRQEKLLKKFNDGFLLIERIQKIIAGKARPNDKEKKLIAKLNAQTIKTNIEMYPVYYKFLLKQEYELHDVIVVQSPAGEEIRGKVELIEKRDNGLYEILFRVETSKDNFLEKIIHNFLFDKHGSMFKFKNNIDVFLCEIDANLFGILPLFIIENVFSEFYAQISQEQQNFYKQTSLHPHRLTTGMHFSPRLIELFNTGDKYMSDDLLYESFVQKIIRPDYLDMAPGVIGRFREKNEIEKSLFLLKVLIQHQRGDRDNFWAYRYLSVLYFGQKNYSLAAKNYKLILKKGGTLNEHEKLYYSDSLQQIGLLKTSAKVLKKSKVYS